MKFDQVGVPFEFYRKVRRDYKDWRFALIRELIQNSVDAGSSRIKVTLEKSETCSLLAVADNGCGMTQEVLKEKFLTLGGSHKKAGDIGGFGMAKMVIFSCDAYIVDTGPYHVEGFGGNYVLEKRPSQRVKGTSVQVKLSLEDYQSFSQIVPEFIKACWLNSFHSLTIEYNGEELPMDQKEFEFEDNIDGFDVFYSETMATSIVTFLWGLRGLPMFTTTQLNPGGRGYSVVVELGDVKSAEAFTTNRDGFTPEMELRTRRISDAIIKSPPKVSYGRSFKFLLNERTPFANNSRVWPTISSMPKYPENFVVRCDGFESRRSTLKQAYVSEKELKEMLNKVRVQKMATMWVRACKLVLSTDYAWNHGVHVYTGPNTKLENPDDHFNVTECDFTFDNQTIYFGIVLNPQAEAMMESKSIMYFNPRYMMEGIEYPLDLYDTAIHEAAHLWEDSHGERFTVIENGLRKSMHRWMTPREVEKIIVNG